MRSIQGREQPLYEDEGIDSGPDPDALPVQDRRLVTQPYDLVITTLLDQISARTLHLRTISDRPTFQRRYVWSDKLASRLIESILLNVPIPPCYLSQNEEFELDVIDGQQRIFSIFRFAKNQLRLSDLEVLTELNGRHYFEIPKNLQRRFDTYALRCVIITNDSHPEIRFDVFERLNTNTVPLNAQELRNCIYRGSLIDLIRRLAEYDQWLTILNRKAPDNRMRGEELILRFFAFHIKGVATYRTPQKHWLNDMAREGRRFNHAQIAQLENIWKETLQKCLIVFKPSECFRRLPLERSREVINRALMDLTMTSLASVPVERVALISEEFYRRYLNVLRDDDFLDLTTRAIDHKSRTLLRFQLWRERVMAGLVE